MLLISRFESFFGLKMCGNGDLKWDVIQNGEQVIEKSLKIRVPWDGVPVLRRTTAM